MVGLVEETGRKNGLEHPLQMTVAATDGERLWAFRYSSEGDSRLLFFSTDVRTLRAQHPDNPRLAELSDESRVVVSEPLGDLSGAWNQCPSRATASCKREPTSSTRSGRCGRSRYLRLTRSAARSAIITVGQFVCPLGRRGMTDASTTRRPSIPRTRSAGSTTASGSVPMRQVPAG